MEFSVTWFAFHGYPTIDLAGSQEKEATSIGFHGYSTQAEAEANPNSVNIVQAPILNMLETDYSYAVRAHEQPGGNHATLTPGNVLAGTGDAAGNYAAQVAKDALGSGWSLTFGNTGGLLGRIIKVTLGAILLIAGIIRMMPDKAALGAAGKVAVFA
jgi:hypothetical protein